MRIQVFKGAIDATRKRGVEQVSVNELEAYAEKLEKIASETPEDISAGDAKMEEYRRNHTAFVAARQQEHENNLEMLRSVITVGQLAIKSALLINGGAAVALLAFVGKLWSSGAVDPVLDGVASGLIQYVWGVLFAAVAAGATYFSQAGYAGEFGNVSHNVGVGGHYVAVLGVLVAYVLFAMASWTTYQAIQGV